MTDDKTREPIGEFKPQHLEDNRPTFSDVRLSRGYSNVVFCQLAQISPSTLSKLENGWPVSRLSAGKALRALGLSFNDVKGIVLTDSPTDSHHKAIDLNKRKDE